MSCSSSRALHNICVPGCPETGGVVLCPCPSSAAFSCRDFCPCDELEYNVFFTQARLTNLVCSAVDTAIAEGCTGFVGTTGFAGCLIASGLLSPPTIPAFGCPVVIGLTGPSPGAVDVGTLLLGVFTPAVDTILDGDYQPTINGQVCGVRTVNFN